MRISNLLDETGEKVNLQLIIIFIANKASTLCNMVYILTFCFLHSYVLSTKTEFIQGIIIAHQSLINYKGCLLWNK